MRAETEKGILRVEKAIEKIITYLILQLNRWTPSGVFW